MRLIFVDTETSGLNPLEHTVLEIALVLWDLKSGEVIDSYESVVAIDRVQFRKAQPKALECNGFTFDELRTKGKPMETVKGDILAFFLRNGINRTNSKFIAQNCSFDKSFFTHILTEDEQRRADLPYHWLDFPSMNFVVCLQNLRCAGTTSTSNYMSIPFSKDYIAYANSLPAEEKPHRAMNGVKHLLLLFKNIVG